MAQTALIFRNQRSQEKVTVSHQLLIILHFICACSVTLRELRIAWSHKSLDKIMQVQIFRIFLRHIGLEDAFKKKANSNMSAGNLRGLRTNRKHLPFAVKMTSFLLPIEWVQLPNHLPFLSAVICSLLNVFHIIQSHPSPVDPQSNLQGFPTNPFFSGTSYKFRGTCH